MAGSTVDGYGPIAGHLWKQKPSWPWRFQWRYVRIERGNMYLFKDAEVAQAGSNECSGHVDLCLNRCIILEDDQSFKRFAVMPGAQGWVHGNFTGVADRRMFYFDADKSEFSREVWIEALRAHISAGQARVVEVARQLSVKQAQDHLTVAPSLLEWLAETEADDPVSRVRSAAPASRKGELAEVVDTIIPSPPGGSDRSASSGVPASGEKRHAAESFQLESESEGQDRTVAARSSLVDRYDNFDLLNRIALSSARQRAAGAEGTESLGAAPLEKAVEQYAMDDDEDSEDGEGFGRGVGSSLSDVFGGFDDPRFCTPQVVITLALSQ